MKIQEDSQEITRVEEESSVNESNPELEESPFENDANLLNVTEPNSESLV